MHIDTLDSCKFVTDYQPLLTSPIKKVKRTV